MGQNGCINHFHTCIRNRFVGRTYCEDRIPSPIRKILRPLADKLLISAAMIALVATRELSGWICFLILTREFAVTGIRTIAASAGYVIAANNWGKLKTVIQMIAVCMSYFPWDFIQSLSGIAWVAALIITVISGATYVKEFIKHEA